MDNYRVLILDPDLGYADSLIVELRTLNSEVDIDRSASVSQAELMLETNDYDVLVCESSLFNERFSYSGVKGIVMLLSNEYAQASGSGISYSLVKPVEPSVLLNRIINVIIGKKRSYSIDERITTILLTCGITPHIRGYRYLRDAIKYVYINSGEHDLKITKDIYPAVARMNQTEPSRIERGIRHAIDSAWERGKLSGVRSVIGLELYDKSYKPTNYEFIRLISDKLLLEQDRENMIV